MTLLRHYYDIIMTFRPRPAAQWRTHPPCYKLFVKKRSGGRKTPSLLQTFCKKAQWRAKKLRERGSNTARQPKKGGGGLPIGSRFARFGREKLTSSWRFVASIGSRFGRFRRVVSCWWSISSRRFVPVVDFDWVVSCRHPSRHPSRCLRRRRRQDTKKPDSQRWGIGLAPAARCRAFLCFR